jgi:response regulator RpfG family c-di-GMP phosphodiesterase
MTQDEALAIITHSAGKQFDRRLIEHFLQIDKAALEQAIYYKPVAKPS